MAESFMELKRNRERSIEELTAEFNKVNKGNFETDDRFWYPTTDKAGNGYAVIRFLPPTMGEKSRFVRKFTHRFQGPGGWYIENCRTTIGEDDPVAEYNSKLWNTGIESNKELVRKMKRKLGFISNVLVKIDQSNPENNGKVKLFEYGKKIWDKANDMAFPKFPGEVAVDVFDPWAGADFIMKIRTVEGYRNYDLCYFDKPAPIGDDAYIESVWKQQYPIEPFIAPSNFKSYEELKKKFYKVLGENQDFRNNAPTQSAPVQRSVPAEGDLPWEGPDLINGVDGPSQEDLAYFQSLASE
jgi:hypothetical protein